LRNSIQPDRFVETNSFDSSSKKIKEENEKRVSELERKFEEVKQGQRELGAEVSRQKYSLENVRTGSPSPNNSESYNQAQIEESHLRKLEEIIDQMSLNVGSIKNNLLLNETNSSSQIWEGSINVESQMRNQTNNGSSSKLNYANPSSSHLDQVSYIVRSFL